MLKTDCLEMHDLLYKQLRVDGYHVVCRAGASKDIIEAIPTVPVPLGGLTEAGDRRCPICLEDYVSGATLRRLHCSHQFHKPCLDKWLEQKATCPICQGDCKAGCSA